MSDAPPTLHVEWSRTPLAPARGPAEQPYGSALTFGSARPHVMANFVETADGVAAFGARGGDDAATVSLDSAIDRWVMALLRSLADAVVIGAGTFRVARSHQWSPGGLVPDAAAAFDELRLTARATRERARLYVVSASGEPDPAHPAFAAPETPVTVLTTGGGARRLAGRLPCAVGVVSLTEGPALPAALIVAHVAAASGGLILCEGGPSLLGSLLAAGLVGELFVTVAPQLAGRDPEHRRIGIVEGFAAPPDEAPRLALHSLRRADDHLFLRYLVEAPAR
jgi:riboflavin biosynthesis pyrimidine reductase